MTTTCVFNLSKVLCSGWNFVSRQSAVFFALEQNDFCSFHEHDSMSKLNVIIIFFFWGRGGGVHFCKAVHGEGLLFVIMTDLYKEVISTGCTTTLLFYLLARIDYFTTLPCASGKHTHLQWTGDFQIYSDSAEIMKWAQRYFPIYLAS